MTDQIVRLGPEYFPEHASGRPVSSGSIYIGEPDTDPEVVVNQITVNAQQESGVIVPISQPILTSAGGIPLYNGSPVTLIVTESYSLKVLDSSDNQIYYVPETVVDSGGTVTTNGIESLDSIYALINVASPDDDDTYLVTDFYSTVAGGGGRTYYWDSTRDQGDADGGLIIDPDTIGGYDGTIGTLPGYLTAQGGSGGAGCWVSTIVELSDPVMFGAIGDSVTDDKEALQKSADVAEGKEIPWYLSKTYGTSVAIATSCNKILGTSPQDTGIKRLNQTDGQIIDWTPLDDGVVEGFRLSYTAETGTGWVVGLSNPASMKISGGGYRVRLLNISFWKVPCALKVTGSNRVQLNHVTGFTVNVPYPAVDLENANGFSMVGGGFVRHGVVTGASYDPGYVPWTKGDNIGLLIDGNAQSQDTVTVDDAQFSRYDININIIAEDTDGAWNMFFSNLILDHGYYNAVKLESDYIMMDIHFTDCHYTGDVQYGIEVLSNLGARIRGVSFNGGQILNTKLDGIIFYGDGLIEDCIVNGMLFQDINTVGAALSCAVYIGENVTRQQVVNTQITELNGDVPEYGVRFTGDPIQGAIVTGNNFTQASVGATAKVSQTVDTWKLRGVRVANNISVDYPRIPLAFAWNAGSGTRFINVTERKYTLFFSGGTVTQVEIGTPDAGGNYTDTVVVVNLAAFSIPVNPGEGITLTYSVAPSVVLVRDAY